ncbi:MAG: Cof-type HAD-IIB family hydrolase [Bacteroidetes bacterium]|nr:Cof-type HAD-IIB family hydrolase [Bacteroidota bacterium]
MLLPISEIKARLKRIKLLVSDVDGTLVNNQNQIGELAKDLVAKLKKKNILFSLASQRIYSSLIPIASSLDIEIPLISLNGALVKGRNGTVLNKSVINPKTVAKAITLAQNSMVRIALCYNDEIIYTDDNSVLKDFMSRVGTTYRLVDSYENYMDDVLEIILMGNDKANVKSIMSKMKFPFNFSLKIKYYRSNSMNKIYNLEILRKGVSKKTGLKELTKYLGVKKNEVVVFGDWYNDRDLFDFGGLNVALNNAVPELKEKANYVTEKTNDEDGVGHFLKLVYDSVS